MEITEKMYALSIMSLVCKMVSTNLEFLEIVTIFAALQNDCGSNLCTT